MMPTLYLASDEVKVREDNKGLLNWALAVPPKRSAMANVRKYAFFMFVGLGSDYCSNSP